MQKYIQFHDIFLAIYFISLNIQFLTAQFDPYDPKHNRFHTNVHSVYEGCGYVKVCVKLCPEDAEACQHCILRHNCPAIVTLQYLNGVLKSQMLISHLSASDEYISMGFSSDGLMRTSPFIACISITNFNGSGSIPAKQMMYAGFTRLDYTVRYLPFDKPEEHFFYNRDIRIQAENDFDPDEDRGALEFEATDGPSLRCSFDWKPEFSINYGGTSGHVEYKLLDPMKQYHIIAARGSAGDAVRGRFIIRGHTRVESGRTSTLHPLTLTKMPVGELNDDYDEYYDGENAGGRNQKESSKATNVFAPPFITIFFCMLMFRYSV